MNKLAQLQKENEALKLKVKQLELLNNWYIEELKLKNKEKFGSSSEKADESQLSLFDLFNEAETLQEPVMQEPAEEEILVPAHKRKKRKPGEYFKNLPVEVIEYKLNEEEQVCDTCGNPLSEMTKEIRRELKVIPASISVVEHVTYLYSCRTCDKEGTSSFIKKADSPKALFPKSIASPSVLAYISNQKYCNAMPLYRQEQDWKRLGVNLSRQNLSNWTLKAANLLSPLAQAMKEQMLKEEILHADETVVEVLQEPGKAATSKSYMWLYRTSQMTEYPVIYYDYQVGRSGIFPKQFLKDWQGTYLHCDGYAGYKQLGGITLCGCLVQAKRKFHEASVANPNNEDAKKGEAYLRKLFALESKADKQAYGLEDRLELRNAESKKILDDFYTFITELSKKTLPQSLLGKAITHAQNQKEYLCNFLKDSRIQLSNNLAEQAIKNFVIGRKNWLFSNTQNGGRGSALIYSVIQTAIENKCSPFPYLEYVFEEMQKNPEVDIAKLLPWSEDIPSKVKINLSQES
ncbi:MAG: IS66 family transposase [Eubacteriales bacterium]